MSNPNDAKREHLARPAEVAAQFSVRESRWQRLGRAA
jgi:hypothetical protein